MTARRTVLIAVLALAAAAALMGALTGTGAITFGGNTPGRVATGALEGETVLTEFLDFNCGYCARFADGIVPLLRAEFVDAGLLRMEYRHYPFLSRTSTMAAEGSECAREQGKFREYHDAVFELSLARGAEGRNLDENDLAAAAERAAVEPVSFIECLESGRGTERVERDLELGRSAGVRGTPTLFLDGKYLQWESYQDLRAQIREAVESNRRDH